MATLARSLERHGYSAGALHGDMDQKSRTETLDAFKSNRLTLLVASDVAARGLDIPAVSHVFNFDVPVHAEDYVHRIGRTGRAGRSGVAYTLVAPADSKHLDAILKLIQKPIEWLDAPAPAAAASSEAEGEAAAPRPSRGRRRGADRSAPPAKTAPAVQAAPVEDAKPAPSPAQEEAPRPSRSRPPRSRPETQSPTESAPVRQDDAGGPFGDAGPVPAFLLRATRVEK